MARRSSPSCPISTFAPEDVRANPPAFERGEAIFEQMLRHGNVPLVLACLAATGAVVGLCRVVIAPNLTCWRPWAIVENVVIAAIQQRQWSGAALLAYAFDRAGRAGLLQGATPERPGRAPAPLLSEGWHG